MKNKEAAVVLLVIGLGLFTTFAADRDNLWADEANYSAEGFEQNGTQYRWIETKTMETGDLDQALLDTVNGYVHVEAQDDPNSKTVDVEAEILITRGRLFSSEEKVLEAKKATGLRVEEKDRQLFIKGTQPRKTPWGIKNIVVHLKVKAPAGLKLKANSVNGEVRAHGMLAGLDLETVNGRIETAACSGPLEVNSVNGRIDLEGMKEEASVETVNGSVRSEFVSSPDGDCRFSTVNGSVRVTFPPSSALSLDLSTVNGSIEFDQTEFQGEAKKKSVHGTVRGGGPAIHADTVNGSIHLN